MPNLKEVKNRIVSVTSTQQITKAMKMVAAAKLRRAQESIMQMRPYAQKLNEILQNVSTAQVETPYAEQREVQNILVIAVTADRGLSGAFNTNIFRRVRIMLEEELSSYQAKGTLEIMPIGKKGVDFFKRREVRTDNSFGTLFSRLSFDEARAVAEHAMQGFVEGRYDKVLVVYNEFKNVATQIVRTEQLLPIVPAEPTTDAPISNIDYIFEPTKEEIVTELIPKSIKVQFYKMLLESRASEEGARMTAMDKATDNAGELLKELKLMYNRTRQAAITKEILEIVGGAEALAKG
ncbi:ATP synthase F1 subunit gamma [Cesiribacter andamanensis]|uniref:ATP synthase gamma chain n=1 Tax=Cesiribacter andamanensis AMV16 TaxID=1279009 RepID=M7NTN1_9BACT|nr:ATP synthase F1 subunit gamma [Cesiribacter andamanensis]EMR01814.1 F-ATPase gamma subunit [Cesiribacter andamanensis AMV16]